MPRRISSYDLILFHGRSGRHRSLTRDAIIHVQRLLDQTITSPRDRTELDLWLDSVGGDAHATYKLALDLRARARRLRVFIPDCAKSAATLLVLGMDEIYMGPAAELGPLDVQIPHPDREEERISGLDVAGSLSYLYKLAMEMTLTGGATIIQYTGLARAEILRATMDFVAKFLQPCVAKVDPHLTRRAVYQLEVAERYALAMLAARNVPARKKLADEDAKKMVRQLVTAYPVHEFVISRKEASAIGLPVEWAEQHARWGVIKEVHDRFLEAGATIVEVVKHATPKRPARVKRKRAEKERARKKNGDGQDITGPSADADGTTGGR